MGVTGLSNFVVSPPFSSRGTLVKFHLISQSMTPFLSLWVSQSKIGAMSSPFTDTFEAIGKVTLYLPVQKVLISALEPGSWPPKLLAGNPMTTSLSLYFSYSFSRSAYCLVKPHWEAVLTMRIFLPLYSFRLRAPPSMSVTLNLYTLFGVTVNMSIILTRRGFNIAY